MLISRCARREAQQVVVIGGGTAGYNAAQMPTACAPGHRPRRQRRAARPTRFRSSAAASPPSHRPLLDPRRDRRRRPGHRIGAHSGARAPKLVTNDMVASAKPGSVFVDIAVDQGGCFADTHATTTPTRSTPCTTASSTRLPACRRRAGHLDLRTFTNATLPYVTKLADLGWREALCHDRTLARGLSTVAGELTSEPVAAAWGHLRPSSTCSQHSLRLTDSSTRHCRRRSRGCRTQDGQTSILVGWARRPPVPSASSSHGNKGVPT